MFCFVIDEDFPWAPSMIENDDPGKSKLRAFKEKIKIGPAPDVFTTPDDLAAKVVASVGHYITQSEPENLSTVADFDYGDMARVKTLQQLQSYYNVDDSNRVVHIRDTQLQEIKNWIENWNKKTEILVTTTGSTTTTSRDTSLTESMLSGPSASAKTRRAVLLITGDPGSGKSWLAYRLIHDLMTEEKYNTSVINGTNIRNQFFISRGDSNKSDTKESSKRSVFILDDRGTSVGVASSYINLEDIYQILKVILLPSGLDQDFAGPLILSIREANWNYIVNGAQSKIKLDEYRLKELVRKVVLQNLEYKESAKMVESFYKVVEGSRNPPYPNLKVDENVKEKVIEKANGIPFIVKLFFEQIINTKAINRNITIEVTLADAEGIISNAKYYALKQIFNYYPIKTEERVRTSNTLSFLYFLAKNGSISIGLLDYLREKTKKKIIFLIM